MHTDNGREFQNQEVAQEVAKFGEKLIHGGPYHPQSQGLVERFNQTLKGGLLIQLHENESTVWSKFVEPCLQAYLTTPHSGLPKNITPQQVWRKTVEKLNDPSLSEQEKSIAKVKACSLIHSIASHQSKIAAAKMKARKKRFLITSSLKKVILFSLEYQIK